MKVVHRKKGNGENVVVYGVVKGLVSEGRAVENIIERGKPERIAVAISPEELKGLRELTLDDLDELTLTRYEENYANGLSMYGEVAFPPPCFVKAVETADRFGIEVLPIDLPEADFTDLYCKEVSTLTIMFHTARLPVFDRTRPRGANAEEFVVWWDRKVNSIGGFKKLNAARERHISREIEGLTGDAMVFLEYERTGNVCDILSSGKT